MLHVFTQYMKYFYFTSSMFTQKQWLTFKTQNPLIQEEPECKLLNI